LSVWKGENLGSDLPNLKTTIFSRIYQAKIKERKILILLFVFSKRQKHTYKNGGKIIKPKIFSFILYNKKIQISLPFLYAFLDI